MKVLTILLVIILSVSYLRASGVESISPQNSQLLIKKKEAIIVDVREIDETSAGAVKGAIYLPLSLMNQNKKEFDQKVMQLPKDKTIIVYCRSGRRSGIVGEALKKEGYKVLNMGGFDSWKEAGLETEEIKCTSC